MARALGQGAALAPRGWNRPVRPGALLVVGAVVLLVWGCLMVAATWFVYAHLDAIVDLRQQPVALRLPEGLQALAEVSAPVQTRVDLAPRVVVPLRQTLAVEVSDSLQARARLQTRVPVDTVVHVAQSVPVRTSLQLSVPVVSWLPRFEVTVPLVLDLPVKLDVPIQLQVPLDLDVLASGELRAPLQVPLDVNLPLRPEVRGELQVGIGRQMAFRLLGPMPTMPVTIERARLNLPFSQPRVRQQGHLATEARCQSAHRDMRTPRDGVQAGRHGVYPGCVLRSAGS